MNENSDRVIVVQLLKEDQWIDCHHTFDDPNVIRRIFSVLQSQFHETPLRICDKFGAEIDMAPYIKSPAKKYQRRFYNE
jgi:predicted glycoside hydrolase/deacetylase ChbG (UPF0249 family)